MTAPRPGVVDTSLPRVREYLDKAVSEAFHEAAHAIRAVREYCDVLDATVRACAERNGTPCAPCLAKEQVSTDIKSLLREVSS